MIYVWMLGVALVLMIPLLAVFFNGKPTRNRREAALQLHQAQLAELERDLADGRIGGPEYQAAKLEISRRVLGVDTMTEQPADGNGRFLLIATVLAVPVMAFALYLPGSTPHVPSEPHSKWLLQQQAVNTRLAGFITALQMHLATVSPDSVNASQGQAYLAEALSEQAGQITPKALGLFKESLTHAPAGATWRVLDQQRIAQAMGSAGQ